MVSKSLKSVAVIVCFLCFGSSLFAGKPFADFEGIELIGERQVEGDVVFMGQPRSSSSPYFDFTMHVANRIDLLGSRQNPPTRVMAVSDALQVSDLGVGVGTAVMFYTFKREERQTCTGTVNRVYVTREYVQLDEHGRIVDHYSQPMPAFDPNDTRTLQDMAGLDFYNFKRGQYFYIR